MFKNISISVLVFVCMLLTACNDLDLSKEMLPVDRQLILTFLEVESGDFEGSKEAVAKLDNIWKELMNKRNYYIENGPVYLEMKAIGLKIEDALSTFDGDMPPANMDAVYAELDVFRNELINMRITYEIPYYIDNLHAFQRDMDQVECMVLSEMYCHDIEWKLLDRMVMDMLGSWEKVMEEDVPVDLLGWDESARREYANQCYDIDKNMSEFMAGFDCADQEMMAEPLRDIQFGFNQLYRFIAEEEPAGVIFAKE